MNPSVSEKSFSLGEDETLDSWGQGGIRVIQKKTGYRFSIDVLILSEFIRIKERSRILDLGTGCGVLALILGRTYPHSKITALELSAELIGLARRNMLLNNLQDRLSLLRGDLCQLNKFIRPGNFDAVVSNPPYRPLFKGRINPNPQKAMARHEIKATLPQLVEGVAHALKNRGKWFVIYPAWRLVSLLDVSRQYRLEPKRIQLVHSFEGKEAEWVLMEAAYQGREDLTVLPSLTIYREPGVYATGISQMIWKTWPERNPT